MANEIITKQAVNLLYPMQYLSWGSEVFCMTTNEVFCIPPCKIMRSPMKDFAYIIYNLLNIAREIKFLIKNLRGVKPLVTCQFLQNCHVHFFVIYKIPFNYNIFFADYIAF